MTVQAQAYDYDCNKLVVKCVLMHNIDCGILSVHLFINLSCIETN